MEDFYKKIILKGRDGSSISVDAAAITHFIPEPTPYGFRPTTLVLLDNGKKFPVNDTIEELEAAKQGRPSQAMKEGWRVELKRTAEELTGGWKAALAIETESIMADVERENKKIEPALEQKRAEQSRLKNEALSIVQSRAQRWWWGRVSSYVSGQSKVEQDKLRALRDTVRLIISERRGLTAEAIDKSCNPERAQRIRILNENIENVTSGSWLEQELSAAQEKFAAYMAQVNAGVTAKFKIVASPPDSQDGRPDHEHVREQGELTIEEWELLTPQERSGQIELPDHHELGVRDFLRKEEVERQRDEQIRLVRLEREACERQSRDHDLGRTMER